MKSDKMPAGTTLSPVYAEGVLVGPQTALRHEMTPSAELPSRPMPSVRSVMQDIARQGREAMAPQATAPTPAPKQPKKEYNPYHKQKESVVLQRQTESAAEEAKAVKKLGTSLQERSMQMDARVKPRQETGPKADREITKKSAVGRSLDAPRHFNMVRAARVAAAEARLGVKSDEMQTATIEKTN